MSRFGSAVIPTNHINLNFIVAFLNVHKKMAENIKYFQKLKQLRRKCAVTIMNT